MTWKVYGPVPVDGKCGTLMNDRMNRFPSLYVKAWPEPWVAWLLHCYRRS